MKTRAWPHWSSNSESSRAAAAAPGTATERKRLPQHGGVIRPGPGGPETAFVGHQDDVQAFNLIKNHGLRDQRYSRPVSLTSRARPRHGLTPADRVPAANKGYIRDSLTVSPAGYLSMPKVVLSFLWDGRFLSLYMASCVAVLLSLGQFP